VTIKRIDAGKGHHYIDTETGIRIPGATTILGDGVPKPALINWSATATAEYAVDHWDELTAAAPSARLKTLNGARYAVKDEAANRGTQVHTLAEHLVKGERISVPTGLEGYVEAYVRFLDEFNVRPIEVEGLVWSEEHNYCGTFDLIAELDNPDSDDTTLWLLDIKTNRSGIFGETALQLAAYRYADHLIVDNEALPMREVERTGAIHVRPNGCSLIPVEAEELQFRQFLYAKQVAEFVKTSRDLVGDAIRPPTTSLYQLTQVEREEVLF